MKKLILLCVLLMGCTADPLPPQVVEVPVAQPIEGGLIVEYIDLKLENERLIQELNDANAEKSAYYDLYREYRDDYYDYSHIVLYLLDYLPEDQQEIMICDGWNGIIVHFLDEDRLDNCLDIDKLSEYVKEIRSPYPYYYPDFWQIPEHETPSTPCTNFCDNEIVEQEQYPEP